MSRFATISLTLFAALLAARVAHAQQGIELDPSGGTPAPSGSPSEPSGGDYGQGQGYDQGQGQGEAPMGTAGAPGARTAAPAGGPAAPAADQGFYYTDSAGDDRGGAFGDEAVGTANRGPTPEVHVVKKGDTLWDLSAYYFNNPWEWPKVWSYNEKITNPHWIYPGDLVRLMPPGTTAPGPTLAMNQLPLAGPAPASLAREGAAAPSGVELRQVAFVDQDDLRFAGKILGAPEEKVLLSPGDDVYIEYPEGKPPQVGKRYAVYSETQPVKDPESGEKLGSYVTVRGEIQILEVKKGKKAVGVLTYTNDVVTRGDRVGPTKTQFKQVAPVAAEQSVEGTIIAGFGTDAIIGANQIVFIDRGSEQGVRPGNRMLVVRRGDAYQPQKGPRSAIKRDARDYPDEALAQILIVDTGKHSSVGLVTYSAQEAEIGDTVVMRKGR